MQDSLTAQMPRTCRPFEWRLTRYLTAPLQALPPDVAAELRGSLFNRMHAVVGAILMIFGTALALAIHRPTRAFVAWAILDGVFMVVRLALIGSILAYRRRHPAEATPPGMAADVHVLLGNIWCAMLGCGVVLCLVSNEMAVALIGNLLAMGTMGGQCARAFATPRLVVLHCVLLTLPFNVAGLLSPDPFMRWVSVLTPAFLSTMIVINRQMHRDYVEMITGRLDSRRLALRCTLTSLANRRMFDQALLDALRPPVRNGGRRAGPAPGLMKEAGGADGTEAIVFSLDLDGFKAINDAHGHPMGDLLLKQVALRLVSQVPPSSMVARLGGDEFAILLRGEAPAAIEAIADRILFNLHEPFDLEGRQVRIGVSIGIACGSPGQIMPETLFGKADEALYAAKRGGKNMFRWYAVPSGLENVYQLGDRLHLLRLAPGTAHRVDEGLARREGVARPGA